MALKSEKTGIKCSKGIFLDELVKEDVNARVSNTIVPADKNKGNINKQLEQVRKDQCEVEPSANANSQPNQLNTEKNQWPSGIGNLIVMVLIRNLYRKGINWSRYVILEVPQLMTKTITLS